MKTMMPTNWTVGRFGAVAALGAVLVVLCVLFVDRPVERFVAAHQGGRLLFQGLASPSLLPLPFACVYLAVVALRKLAGAAAPNRLYLAVSLATVAAVAAKDELKFLFGRPWPESWVKYGLYAFHPFATSWLYGAFPSGHTSYIAAPMGVLWWLVPRWRLLWGGIVGLVMVGLVGAGYHFIGDVVAGLFVGLGAAAGTVAWLRPFQGTA